MARLFPLGNEYLFDVPANSFKRILVRKTRAAKMMSSEESPNKRSTRGWALLQLPFFVCWQHSVQEPPLLF